jgi:hypothetical protein
MRKTAITSIAVAATAIAALLGLGGPGANAAQASAKKPAAVDPTPFGCMTNTACFYDDRGLTNIIWTVPGAPDCEIIDLRKLNPPINDRISAVYNRLESRNVELYAWNEATADWDWVDTVWTGRYAAYTDSRDNSVDGVRIC